MNRATNKFHCDLRHPTKKEMTKERWKKLNDGEWKRHDLPAIELTEAEVKAGWHFCPDWNFRLIHPTDEEYKVCECGHTERYKKEMSK